MARTKMTPPINDESLENKLVALALKQAEIQLSEGVASSQVVTHFLRLASNKAKVELEQLRLQNQLLEEKILAERKGQELNAMFGEVLQALKSYSYSPPGDSHADLL